MNYAKSSLFADTLSTYNQRSFEGGQIKDLFVKGEELCFRSCDLFFLEVHPAKNHGEQGE